MLKEIVDPLVSTVFIPPLMSNQIICYLIYNVVVIYSQSNYFKKLYT